MHQKSIKIRYALQAASSEQVDRFLERENMLASSFQHALFCRKVRFGEPFGGAVDFEGGPKITFLAIMLEKTRKRESRSGSGRNMKFRWILDIKMGRFGQRKSCF